MPFRSSRVQSRLLHDTDDIAITPPVRPSVDITGTAKDHSVQTQSCTPLNSPNSPNPFTCITSQPSNDSRPYAEYVDEPGSPLTTSPLRHYVPVKTGAWWKPSSSNPSSPSKQTEKHNALQTINEDAGLPGRSIGGSRYERKRHVRTICEIAGLVALAMFFIGLAVVCMGWGMGQYGGTSGKILQM
jgi:hypothetical protein